MISQVHGRQDKALEPFADLRCAPGGLLLLQAHDQGLDLKGKLVGLTIRAPRAVGQCFKPAVVIAAKNLVAGLALPRDRALRFPSGCLGLGGSDSIHSSSREETDLARSWDLGVNAYVVKPVNANQFFEAVRTLGQFWAVMNEGRPER